jgi:hypothetical protein
LLLGALSKAAAERIEQHLSIPIHGCGSIQGLLRACSEAQDGSQRRLLVRPLSGTFALLIHGGRASGLLPLLRRPCVQSWRLITRLRLITGLRLLNWMRLLERMSDP